MIGVFATCDIKAGKQEEFEFIAKQFITESRQHTGCIHYDCGKVAGTNNRYVFLEKWASQAELDAHLATPFFQNNVSALIALTENGLNIQTAELIVN